MEWIIIILLVIFIIMVFTLKPNYANQYKPQTQMVQCNKNIDITPLVMLPNPNPTSLIQH